MTDLSWPNSVRVGLLCVIYMGAAMLGLSLDAVGGIATVVWPPTGIALAALTLYGFRLWPGIVLGAFLVNAWAGAPLLAAGGVAVGNTIEALLGAFLLRRVVRFRPALDRLQDVLGLVVLAAVLSTLVSATIGVTSGWLGGIIPPGHYGRAWWTWWLGDAMGALVVAPLVFVWSTRPGRHLRPEQMMEAGALLCAVGGISVAVFSGLLTTPHAEVSYLVFPVLIWAAIRFGQPGVVTALSIVSLMAIWGTAQGLGPFARETLHAGLLWLQAFMSVVTVTSLVLAAVMAERRRVDAQLAAIVASSDDAIIGKTLEGVITSWNMGAERLYGYAADEVMGLPIALLVPPERSDEVPAILVRLRKGERTQRVETVRMRKDGQRLDVALSISAIRDANGRLIGASTIARDITERKQVEAHLKVSLQEKEVLLREIHHRVKNNLQVVSSLLSLQARAIQDPHIRAYFQDSQDRIKAMALIHEKLYQSGDLAQIDFAEYLRDLATSLVRSYRIGQGRLALDISTEEVCLHIATAIPCGLVLHELLSNCVKHAFPGGRSGTIKVILRRNPQRTYVLTVSDDGVGLPPGLDVHTTPSLGLRLVQLLAAQLHGSVRFERQQGTTITLTFDATPSPIRPYSTGPRSPRGS
jgi:PAS domain S-box-containing protein